MLSQDFINILPSYTIISQVLLYIFQSVAILLDEYLVPAIDKICLALKLPTEVAGATLVAIGSALPDILATTIG